MKLRKKILISISCMILGALILLLCVGGMVLRSFSNKYDSMPHQMVDKNIFEAEEILTASAGSQKDWEALDEQLHKIGYQLFVIQGNEAVYSPVTPDKSEMLSQIMELRWDDDGPRRYSIIGVTVVGLKQQNQVLVAQCMHEHEQVHDMWERQAGSVMVTFLVVGLIAIGIIVCLSQIFTYYLAKSIMAPINALEAGAERIAQGNLTVLIAYQGHDEFVTVCNTFNQMQEHLASEQARTAAYEKARTDMITGISHDLRTPLTSMKGYIKGIQDGVANTPEKMDQYLSIAYRKACDMDVLLQKLFYSSRMETGKLLLDLEQTDLGGFAQRFANSVADELKQKQATIKVCCTKGSHPVRIDEEQMYRVLSNLLENTQKYAKADPLLITLTVWRENGREHLSYQDNGMGILDEQLPMLFEQFWRADEARSSQNEKGSGLGLYIVKYIIEAHHGTITAVNENGLKFDIAIPKGANVRNV